MRDPDELIDKNKQVSKLKAKSNQVSDVGQGSVQFSKVHEK
jgi:hypothetical protein